jgi:uncharacterized protein HemX
MSVTEPPVTVAAPAAPAAPLAPAAPAAPPEPMIPEPAAGSSKAWLGWLAGLVVVALLAGATAVLFVRVQDAQQQADDATAVATVAGGSQAQLQVQLDQINQTLTEIQQDGQATRDDVADLTSQYTALRKCVNTALDAIAQAGQTGKPVAVTKC